MKFALETSTISWAARTIISPISCMGRSNVRSSKRVMTLAVWFIWSMASTIEVMRCFYNPHHYRRD